MLEREKLKFSIILLVVCTTVGGLLTVFFQRFISFAPQTQTTSALSVAKVPETGSVAYNPPTPQDAPAEIREAVMLGYNILNDPGKYASAYVGNPLRCSNCHLKAGLSQGGKNGGISLVGVGSVYPKFRKRQEFSVHLVTRTNDCFKRSMNGRPLPEDSREMTAIVTYYAWISKGLPIYGPVPWLGLPKITSTHTADTAAGKAVYAAKCALCHGVGGDGTATAPPVWGAKSFNDGAGMAKPETLASFAQNNMPLGNPDLNVEQAIDVAAFVTTQSRPHFPQK